METAAVRSARYSVLALALGCAAARLAPRHVAQATPPPQPPQEEAAPAERPPKPHYRLPRISTPIKIDGVLDDPAWREALTIDVNNEFDPRRNVAAPVTTICYLAYDDDNLYAGFRANAPDPEAIRAHLSDRDNAFRDDFVGLILDTFNDERRGYEFFVDPLTSDMDLSLNEMTEPEEDTVWTRSGLGRPHRRPGLCGGDGHPVQLAPLPEHERRADLGIGPFRSHKRSLRHQIASTYQAPDDGCFVCQSPKVTGFEGIKPGLNLELDPTLTGQRTDRRRFSQAGTWSRNEQGDLGLTARWESLPT